MATVYWGDGTRSRYKTLFISNPVAGASRGSRDWGWATALLRAKGDQVGEFVTGAQGDAYRAACRAIQEGCDRIVVAGGDGTINEVLQAIATKDIALGIIPAGTTNVLSSELGISNDYQEALSLILDGDTRQIDLGTANGRYFSMMTGVGFDARMTFEIEPKVKSRLGNVAFVPAWLKAFFGHRARRMSIEVDKGLPTHRKLRRLVFMLVASNTGFYGGTVLKINETADVSDGLLNVCILRSRRWHDVIRHFLGTVVGMNHQFDDVEHFQARRLTLNTSSPVPYQLDGDAVGKTPLEIELIPGALKVIAPVAKAAE